MQIKVQTTIKSDPKKVWDYYTLPEHVVNWNQASSDWHCPKATNDLKVGGKFVYTMSARDGSATFDFSGLYSKVELNKCIEYSMEDGRQVSVNFSSAINNSVFIEITFDPENVYPHEKQREGWQAILDSFKNYVEEN